MDGILGDLAPLMRYRDRVGSAGFVEPMGKIRAARPGIGRELGPDLPEPTRDRLGLSLPAPREGGKAGLRCRTPATAGSE